MKGIEMMLANLLGMKPEQMREQVEQALTLMRTGANAAAKMQSDIDLIKKHLGITDTVQEETINVGAIAANHSGSANGNRIEL